MKQLTRRKIDHNEATQEEKLIQWGALVLPWLTPKELSNASRSCKTLFLLANSIQHRRCLDASRSMEAACVPFHNPLKHPPYHHFLYAKSQFISTSQSLTFTPRQSWGGFDSLHSSSINAPNRSLHPCRCTGVDDIMVDCGEHCITRRRISLKLKIVWGEKKGWGLFADEAIAKHQFICEYAGELLTTEEARKRQSIYDCYSRIEKFSSALLVVREHLPSGKACLRMNIDATRIGNIARFINHSCDGGNLLSVLIRSCDSVLPRLCFFSAREIEEGEELTFSYGETRNRSNGAECFCGSACCLGTLPSEDT